MVILRILGALPPDLEVELYRETSGETVLWSGRSSGLIEKFQGWAMVGAGSLFALFNLAGPAAALGFLVDLAERGRTPDIGAAAATIVGLVFFIFGVAMAAYGWRYLQSAENVVWAVTNRRLLRLVAGGAQPVRSWARDEIVKIDRINWTDPQKRALAVTVRGDGDSNPVLIIMGPTDLEAAERALTQMER